MTDNTGKKIEHQVRRLARNSVVLAAGGITAQFAFTLIEILVARKLGAETYGVFVTAYAWTVLASCLIDFGTSLWTIQEGSRRRARLPALLGSGLSVNFLVFACLYLVLAIVTIRMAAPGPVQMFLLTLLPYGLILGLQHQLAAVFSSVQTMQVNALFQGLTPVVILGFYFAWSAREMTLSDVAFAYVIGGAIATALWFIYTLRRIRPRFSATHLLATLRFSYPYGLSSTLGQIFFRTDIVMLAALAGVREAGIYAAAFKLVDLVAKVAVLVGRVFAPAIFKASHESGKSFEVYASMMTRVLAIGGLLAGVVSFVLADEIILLLFGETYASSASILRILGGVMATRCMMVALQLLLSSIDLHMKRVTGLAITAVIHVAASAILAPRFGAAGAACATLASGTLVVLLYALSASAGRPFRLARWLLLPSSIALLAGAVAFFPQLNPVLAAIIAISVFIAGLVASGFIEQHEVRFVLRSILAGGSRQP